ncbi:MAG: F0F1 ATP synthase subunit delta [Gammaproteobacteria bacterium]|nr:F0F1 ATP synthase subunit delta [Gammaproteobacteria bacterium]MYJ74803.1 F0F1 ATP synthase subunit delta [Gammaproteobacteria bacterium]
MAEIATLARPYANAVFGLARSAGRMTAWSPMLALLARAVETNEVKELVASPSLAPAVKAHQLIDVVREDIDDRCRRFVNVLADNHRLELLPEIAMQFEALKAEAEKTIDVEIIAAVELTDQQIDTYTEALRERFEQDVNVSVGIDPALVGGAVVRAGDTVIDGSVRGRLTRLIESLQRT